MLELWNSIPLKAQLTIAGLSVTIARDAYTYFQARYRAIEAGEKPQAFRWGLAVPMWFIGGMSGLGLGTGIEALPQ